MAQRDANGRFIKGSGKPKRGKAAVVGVQIEGLNAVQEAMKQAGDRYAQATAAALYQNGFIVDRGAVLIVPVDTGRLRNSHYVAPPKVTAAQAMAVEIGFGTNYAVQVHERPNGPGRTKGQTNKYLEISLNNHSREFKTKMASLTKRNYDRGIGVNAVSASAPKKPKT